MLAHRLATILSAMNIAEAIETRRIYRVARYTGARTEVVRPAHFALRILRVRMWR
jgi:hypothetical protein